MINPTCSIIQFVADTTTAPIPFQEAIAGIRDGRWAAGVAAVRKAYAAGSIATATPKEIRGKMETQDEARKRVIKEHIDEPKKALPGILFSGTFNYRNEDELIRHSGLICADLDDLGDQVDSVKERIASDPHCIAAFVSPSGTGVKAVFRCDPSKPHEEAFEALAHYIEKHFGLNIDGKCADVCRICFVGHDPEAFIAEEAEPLPPFDPATRPPAKEYKPKPVHIPGTDITPIDDYLIRGAETVPDILERNGWSKYRDIYWTRPGKKSGISASWGYLPGVFIVHSTSGDTGFPLDKKGFDAFDVLCYLEHNGNSHTATKAIYAQGYGTRMKGDKKAEKKAEKSKQEALLDHLAGPPKPIDPRAARPITSFAYPCDDDPNMLLGSDDYLGRGGGMLFVSHAGAGKSSWALDACMTWGLGEPWMGIKCAQPIKSLIVQSEDSDRYIGKIFGSFAHVKKLDSHKTEQLSKNVVMVRLKGVSGEKFFIELKRLVEEHKPDLVVINPLYLYADGDISRSEYAQPFLMNLDAINKEERFAYILIHHTGKPTQKNNGKRVEVEDWESAYMGFGSSYLANWPRATVLLEPVAGEIGRYQIKLGKGGLNAGVTKEVAQGVAIRHEPTTRIAIRHSQEKMLVGNRERRVYYWEIDTEAPVQQEVTKSKGGRPPKWNIESYMRFIPAHLADALPAPQIHRSMGNATGIAISSFCELLFKASGRGEIMLTDVPGKGHCYHQMP
jgi:hypothetical protein